MGCWRGRSIKLHQIGAEKLQQAVGEFPALLYKRRATNTGATQGAHGTIATRNACYETIDEREEEIEKK